MSAQESAERLKPAFWRETLSPYAKPDLRRALLDVATSALPYLAVTALMYLVAPVSTLLVVALAIPATGFLVRTFIVFHDCSHGSFLPSRRANTWLGVACGLLVYSPFHAWRHEHAVHHATAGDLDRRGMGDVDTLTVAEYTALPRGQRLGYRLMRNPVVLLGFGPLWALILEPRLVPRWARERFGRKIIATDVALAVLLGGLCALFGWHAVLLIQLLPAMLAGGVGIWLFYVQHQFEDVYWERKEEWSYAASALRGSSHLRLPKVLQFFTGNIGLHHVHHLNARIPNYNLQRAHDENPVFHDVRELNFWQAVLALRLKLYDERSGRLVNFAQARTV
ncbi:MAG TPA: fatty acid desaturase [Solirubrobacteraceae bacterium]|jgi:omega-6 fatty acid desaturase (delta-12 desaturase)|nr:fatty acid desaturase [Solirubrobacteraceae bacterium]